MKSRKPSVGDRAYISFFSGALGFDLGLEAAGLQLLAANEFDGTICDTIRENRPNLKLYDCDIRALESKSLFRDLSLEPEQLFAVVGGPPCQAFSTAGRRLGLNDERGNVFLHFIALVGALRPKFAIFENVRGLLSAPLMHRPHNQRGKGFSGLERDELPGGALLHVLDLLERAGYSTTFTLYNMANYGVPQIRERLIFFACREGAHVPYIPPSHSESGSSGSNKWQTLRDAIRTDRQGSECSRFPEKRLKYFAMLREGQNWRDLPENLQREAMGPSFFAGGGKTGFYRRLAWDKPAPTLVTRPNMPATSLCHPTELRPLSVAEYSAIQTFPGDYIFHGKLDDKYRQIGNAVPPRFAEAIGRHIINFVEGKLIDVLSPSNLSRYRGTDHHSWKQSVLDQQSYLF